MSTKSMSLPLPLRWSLVGVAASLGVLATTGSAGAQSFYGIISTVRTSPKTMARLNVSYYQPSSVTFTVFPPGGLSFPHYDVVQLDTNLFASSASSTKPEIQNLFTGAGGQTALVKVEVNGATARSGAVLEQASADGKVVLNLPPYQVAAGDLFTFPIGDLQQGTSLLVGNPNQTAVAVFVAYGTNLPGPDIEVAPYSAAVIDVTQANTLLRLEAKGALPIIAQLAVDTGKTTVMTYLSPESN